MSKPIKIIKPWEPFKNSSQELVYSLIADETLNHGTRGPGKTITQAQCFRKYVGLGYGEYWKGIIIDRKFEDLSGIIAETKKWFPKYKDGCVFKDSSNLYKWVWPTGEELLFRHLMKPEDYLTYHGKEFPFIGWNELTKWPTSELYDLMESVNRSSFVPERDTPKFKSGNYKTPNGLPLPPIPLKIVSTTNPKGPGHNWVKARFIDPAPNGVIVENEIEIFNPQTQKDEIFKKSQVAIFGSYRENIYLPPSYIAKLNSIADDVTRRAWLLGDWDIIAGGAFDDLWRTDIHILPRFKIPKSWHVDRAFDWGSTQPFYIGWFAESNGESAIIEVAGEKFEFCPPPGTLVLLYEWYGSEKIGTNKGIKMSATDISAGISDRQKLLKSGGWINGNVWAGPADNSIGDIKESDQPSIKEKMSACGVEWERSDKSAGSRVIGLQLFRDRLQASLRNEGPGIYFMSNCTVATTTIPVLPRDEKNQDDIDTTAEDHPYDVVRYRILNSKFSAKKINVSKVN